MTSFLTTGGMRGHSENMIAKFYPRTHNMAIKKAIYDQIPLKLTPNAINSLSQKKPILVPIFSERSGQILSKQFTKKMTSPRIAVCLSSQIANNIAKNEYDKILTSQNPDMESLIALLKEII